MNLYAIKAIYLFELARTWRTLLQSIATPVISTSLYFVVFGSAIGSSMTEVHGVSYGAFIVPGLIMLALLTESIGNASFGIYMPKYSGTIYEILSAPVSYFEILVGYVGAAATKSVILGLIIVGLGEGTMLTLLFNVLVSSSPKEYAGDVGALRGVVNNVSSALGAAFAGVVAVSLLAVVVTSALNRCQPRISSGSVCIVRCLTRRDWRRSAHWPE